VKCRIGETTNTKGIAVINALVASVLDLIGPVSKQWIPLKNASAVRNLFLMSATNIIKCTKFVKSTNAVLSAKFDMKFVGASQKKKANQKSN
jgi:hypothetical protein